MTQKAPDMRVSSADGRIEAEMEKMDLPKVRRRRKGSFSDNPFTDGTEDHEHAAEKEEDDCT